ncbi:MAG: N-acetyltransferase [Bacillota bacterium]
MTFRKARMADVESLHELINFFAEQGLMLPRARSFFYENLREFIIADVDGAFAGGGALHIIWDNLAEVRALAIKPEGQGRGIGRQMVAKLVEEALELGINRVFTLTYQAAFFQKCGFREVPKEEMPHKVWKECINCPKFPNCDEIAMIRNL